MRPFCTGSIVIAISTRGFCASRTRLRLARSIRNIGRSPSCRPYPLYVYGYRCAPDRLKIGSTEVDTVQRIAAQITTSTPFKPVLLIEIKTDVCRAFIQDLLRLASKHA